MGIIWKDIKGYEGLYQISNVGQVKSLDRIVKHSGENERIQKGRILKPFFNKDTGYVEIGLSKNGKSKKHRIHRLVADAFVPNLENKLEVNHIDEDKQKNTAINLEWCTRKENENHGTKQMRKKSNTDYKAIGKKNMKKVMQYDIDGNLVKEWESLSQINKELGYSTGNISSCCNGKLKKIYGSIWKFKDVI